MKFGDKEILGSTRDVNKNLRQLISVLEEKVSKVVQKQEYDYALFSLRAIASYSGVLFERLISSKDSPIEYIAILARNLFECYLLAAYIIGDPSKGKEFVGQKAYEELEINEGFLSIAKESKNTSEMCIVLK